MINLLDRPQRVRFSAPVRSRPLVASRGAGDRGLLPEELRRHVPDVLEDRDAAGLEQSAIYGYLGQTGSLPTWNFAKYVVDKDGKVVKFFNSKVTPDAPELRETIDAALAK